MLAGRHGGMLAGKAEGVTEVPVIVARGWPKSSVRAYALADNKLSLNSEWDDEALAAELGELKLLGVVEMTLTGFSDEEWAEDPRSEADKRNRPARVALVLNVTSRFQIGGRRMRVGWRGRSIG
jgi:hypothetical protein